MKWSTSQVLDRQMSFWKSGQVPVTWPNCSSKGPRRLLLSKLTHVWWPNWAKDLSIRNFQANLSWSQATSCTLNCHFLISALPTSLIKSVRPWHSSSCHINQCSDAPFLCSKNNSPKDWSQNQVPNCTVDWVWTFNSCPKSTTWSR
jgi:hypothetical protein